MKLGILLIIATLLGSPTCLHLSLASHTPGDSFLTALASCTEKMYYVLVVPARLKPVPSMDLILFIFISPSLTSVW